jgi:uncharacterized membrane protein
VLTVLVGAMVSLIGFVFTISVLVVQTATGTLSPRYMRLWYRDKLQKLVLATFVGTVTFSFWLLRHVTTNRVPDLGVTAAGLAVTVSLLLLLLYLDRFLHGLRPVAVGALVARAGRSVVGAEPVARERTLEQDPAFAMRILVDIAIRALSPGVNDPTTAVQLIDYVEDLLRAIGEVPGPSRGVLRDHNGRPRVLVPIRVLGGLPPPRRHRDPRVRRPRGADSAPAPRHAR